MLQNLFLELQILDFRCSGFLDEATIRRGIKRLEGKMSLVLRCKRTGRLNYEWVIQSSIPKHHEIPTDQVKSSSRSAPEQHHRSAPNSPAQPFSFLLMRVTSPPERATLCETIILQVEDLRYDNFPRSRTCSPVGINIKETRANTAHSRRFPLTRDTSEFSIRIRLRRSAAGAGRRRKFIPLWLPAPWRLRTRPPDVVKPLQFPRYSTNRIRSAPDVINTARHVVRIAWLLLPPVQLWGLISSWSSVPFSTTAQTPHSSRASRCRDFFADADPSVGGHFEPITCCPHRVPERIAWLPGSETAASFAPDCCKTNSRRPGAGHVESPWGSKPLQHPKPRKPASLRRELPGERIIRWRAVLNFRVIIMETDALEYLIFLCIVCWTAVVL